MLLVQVLYYLIFSQKMTTSQSYIQIQQMTFTLETGGICALALVIFAQYITMVPPWISRKMVHIGIGYILTNIIIDTRLKMIVIIISVLLNYLLFKYKLLRFADKLDKGILSYCYIILFCLVFNVPLLNIKPLFYADPFGAIIGKTIPFVGWCNQKTISGSSAVFIVSVLTLYGNIYNVLISAFTLTIIEGISGKWDNTVIGIFLIIRFSLFQL